MQVDFICVSGQVVTPLTHEIGARDHRFAGCLEILDSDRDTLQFAEPGAQHPAELEIHDFDAIVMFRVVQCIDDILHQSLWTPVIEQLFHGAIVRITL